MAESQKQPPYLAFIVGSDELQEQNSLLENWTGSGGYSKDKSSLNG